MRRGSVGLGLVLAPPFALLLALGLSSPAYAQDLDISLPPPAAEGEQTYSEFEVGEGVWEVCLRNGSDFGALGTGFGMAMRIAQVTVDKGYVYSHESDQRQLAPDVFAVRVQMWTEPPEGAHVVRWDDPATFEGKDTAEFVVTHAPSWLAQYDRDTMREQIQRTKRRREELLSSRTVEVDELGLERRPFAPDAEFAGVRTLALAQGVHDWPAPLLVGETWRLSWLSPEGEVVRRYEVPDELARTMPRGRGLGTLEPYRARSGVFGLLSRGGGWSAVSAYSGAGEQLWSWKKLPHGGFEHAPNELSAGDLDGDGAAEFVIGTNGSGGVFFLDDHGRIEHRVPGGNVFSAAILDLDGDGRLEVMHTGAGTFLVRDAEGALLDDVPRPTALGSEFRVVDGRDGTPRVAQLADEVLHLTRPDGSEHERYPLPGIARGDVPTLTWWRREAESDALLVVSARGEVRSEIFVFEATRRLVHHELVGGTGTSGAPILTFPRTDGPDALLVGAHDGLWLYEFPDAR